MKSLWLCLFLSAPAVVFSQQPVPSSSPDAGVVLAGVSRDNSMLAGGISGSSQTANGTVFVEPLARLTSTGEWQKLPCDTSHPDTCLKFEREYLSNPHIYTVVSADGKGAVIHAEPTKLSECYGYTGMGTYSGSDIRHSAIAASSIDFFTDGPPAHLLSKAEAQPILMALNGLIPSKLDSSLYLRLYSLRLEGQELVLIQRAFADYTGKLDTKSPRFIFAIGTMEKGELHLLHWKQNIEDEDERVIGTVHLKGGRDFLITTVCDSESQTFRVYGIRDGKLVMVYFGGGSSC